MSAYEWPAAGAVSLDDDDPQARQRHLTRLRPQLDVDGALEAGRRTAPQGSRRALETARRDGAFAPADVARNLWLPLGPMTVVQGQTAGKQRVAGRVRALAVDADGQRLYAASANGGIWYSDDAGDSWRSIGGFALTDGPSITRPAHRHACGAILVDFDTGTPPDPRRDRVFVGTGEGTPFIDASAGGRLGGTGILVATGPAASEEVDPWQREAPELTGHGVYRLTAEPDGTRMVAATSIGLRERSAGPAQDSPWNPVASPPFDSLRAACTDVLWTAGDGVRPARLWVWVSTGDLAGLWVRPDGAPEFTRLPVPGARPMRSVLAAADPPDTVYLFNDRYSERKSLAKLPGLFRIDASGAGTPTVTEVAGVPDMLEGAGHHDMAIAVHPADPARVILGGKAAGAQNPAGNGFGVEDAAIYVADVGMAGDVLTFGPVTEPTMVGIGAHADVHDLRYARGGARLFTGCDGGVFRSDHPDQQVGFVACNDGLAVIEANFVASHPTCEGHVVAGLQDNGMIERRSGAVWTTTGGGDGGGVAFDPMNPVRYVRQYYNAGWGASVAGGFESLLSRGTPAHLKVWQRRAKNEFLASAFYSMPAVIGHTRGKFDFTQVLLGTDRPWYTEDWGGTWVTLPSGKDPITQSTYNQSQDQLGAGILVCRWANPDLAWVLCEGLVVRLSRTTKDDGSPGAWQKPARRVLRKEAKPKKGESSAPMKSARAWTDLALDFTPTTVDPAARPGPDGAVYVGTTGHPDDPTVDTLWWYDGADTWHPTGLRTEAVPAAVTAVLCDPTRPEHVYVGTTVGVWRGTRTITAGQPPDWVWEALVNGLPEAAVEDLSLFEPDGLRLLRAAINARGVWELAIDADVDELTYVRAHVDDLRRRERAHETQRDGKTPRSWHGSPDVRPRLKPVPVPRPATLPWRRYSVRLSDEGLLRQFKAALRSVTGDPRIRPTGVAWDSYFEEVMRDLGATVTAADDVELDAPFWDAAMVSPHDSAEPWGAGPPSEDDLYDLTPELIEGEATIASCKLAPALMKVDVVVHHRGLLPRDGADVGVTLLHWIDPRTTGSARYDDAQTWFADDIPWSDAVNEVLNSADGTTSLTFGDGWQFTGPAGQLRQTLAGQTLDASRSGIATFEIDLRAADPHPDFVVLLVAIVRAGEDIALTPMKLPDLALEHKGVAVRSMRVASRFSP